MFVKEETRHLARTVTIDDIVTIPKADRLEVAVVGGWECVVKKGLYAVGETALYFEIDSAIPMTHPVLANFDKTYLTKKIDEDTNEEYAVIKTVKLRGVRSQGLLLSVKDYGAVMGQQPAGKNVTDLLGVKKYVSAEEAKLYRAAQNNNRNQTPFRRWWNEQRLKVQGDVIVDGLLPWPVGHQKSEEARLQNANKLYQEIRERDAGVELSIKFNGESATFFTDLDTGNIGAAQRNFALRLEDVPYTFKQSLRVYTADWMRFIVRRLAGGKCSLPSWKRRYDAKSVPLVKYFHESGIGERLAGLNRANYSLLGNRITIQGEMVGPDFHGNAENAKCNEFYMYRAYRGAGEVMTPSDARAVAAGLGIKYIPVVDGYFKLPESMKDLLKMADGPGYFDKTIQREGLVAKCCLTGQSFKIISNKWLEWLDSLEAQKKAEEEAVK
jgi:hypothetical protein